MKKCFLYFLILVVFLDNVYSSVSAVNCKCNESNVGHLVVSCKGNRIDNFTFANNCTVNPQRMINLRIVSYDTYSKTSYKIDDGALTVFPNLRELSLSDLNLTYLPPQAFISLKKLERVDLSGNDIREIPSELFRSQLDRLLHLNLSYNSITNLSSHFLANFFKIETIDLSYNKLSSLPSRKPPRWPYDLKIITHNNFLLPCWNSNGSSISFRNRWWCFNYSLKIDVLCRDILHIPCIEDPSNSSTKGEVAWLSPKRRIFKFVNSTRWRFSFIGDFYPSTVYVTSADKTFALHIEGMRAYFNGVWTCLKVEVKNNSTVVTILKQVLVETKSKMLEIYRWSLIVCAACTVAMILTGLLSALIRILWATRCFTRKVHVIATLSLHDLQYSPRTAQRRISVLRHLETRPNAARSADSSYESLRLPSWLPPHRQRSLDPFAHGGCPTSDDDHSLGISAIPSSSSSSDDEDVAADLGERLDTMEADEHGLRSRVDELRERFRRDVVRKVDVVRLRMRESRHSVGESGTRVMRSLRSTSSVAAAKMRSGLYNSVESVKFQVRSVTEFCGGGSASLGQTVSVATLDTDVDTQETTEHRIADVTAV